MRRKTGIDEVLEHEDTDDHETEAVFAKLHPNCGYKLKDLIAGKVKPPKPPRAHYGLPPKRKKAKKEETIAEMIEQNRKKDVTQYLHFKAYSLTGKLIPRNSNVHRTQEENELLGTLGKTPEGEPMYMSNAFRQTFEEHAVIPDVERYHNTLDLPQEESRQSLPLVKPEVEPEVFTNVMEPIRMSHELVEKMLVENEYLQRRRSHFGKHVPPTKKQRLQSAVMSEDRATMISPADYQNLNNVTTAPGDVTEYGIDTRRRFANIISSQPSTSNNNAAVSTTAASKIITGRPISAPSKYPRRRVQPSQVAASSRVALNQLGSFSAKGRSSAAPFSGNTSSQDITNYGLTQQLPRSNGSVQGKSFVLSKPKTQNVFLTSPYIGEEEAVEEVTDENVQMTNEIVAQSMRSKPSMSKLNTNQMTLIEEE